MEKFDYIEKQIIDKVPSTKYLICDICKRLIYKQNMDSKRINIKPVHWYEVTTGHYDWGNDSCDSIEHYDVCPKCLNKVFHEYFNRSSKGSNTEYINIEHNYTSYYDDITVGNRE